MKKLILTLALALGLASVGSTQVGNPVSGHIASDTAGSVSMIIKYIGTSALATVEVDAATGDIELEINNVDDSANVDTAGVCAGGTANSLDVSDAQCDTFGEIIDLINASTHWRAVLVGAIRADLTTNTQTVLAETSANLAEGLPLYFDSAVSLTTSIAMIPDNCKTDIRCFMSPQGVLKQNAAGGTQTEVRWIEGYATYATTGTFNVYSVKESGAGKAVTSTLYTEASGASGTNEQLSQFTNSPLLGKPHEKVIVRITTTGASSAFNLHAYGFRKGVQ